MTMSRLIAVEFFKLRKRMMTWIVTGVLIALIILLYSILWNVSGRAGGFRDAGVFVTYQSLRRSLFLQAGVPVALQVCAAFGTLLAIILAAGAAGGEYAWGTIRLMATASSGRLRLISARLIVVGGLVAAGVLLAVAVALAYSAIITAVNGGASWQFLTAGWLKDQFLSYLRTIFVIAPYVALAFAAATIGRSTLAGVGAGLGVAFLEPLISGLMRLGGEPWHSLPNYLISANRNIVLLQNHLPPGVPTFGGSDARDARNGTVNSVEEASIILAVWIIVFIALTFAVYRRRDITAGGGA